jgi:hypothetical protein
MKHLFGIFTAQIKMGRGKLLCPNINPHRLGFG